MTEILIFNPDHQEQIAKVAVELSAALEPVLPRVPWLSNSGQQDAFNKIVRMVSDSTDELNADKDSKNAVLFWTLTLLYANKKSFRLATASIKNWGAVGLSPVISTWVSRIGENTHPGQIVAESVASWK